MSDEAKKTLKRSVQKRIEESIRKAEEAQRQDMFRRRIDLARQGVRSFEGRKHKEAVQAFHTYLRILEEWKGCSEGGLLPSQFDRKTDEPELLLISGVYWDLAKLYDRTQSDERAKECFRYLEKFVVFSRGLPHEALSRETIRKYISNDKPKHTDAFAHAYRALGGGKCFVVTALGDEVAPGTIERLQDFRDERLRASVWGRALIRLYYALGPTAATAVRRFPAPLRRRLARLLDALGDTLGAHARRLPAPGCDP